jgi:hypothetical protein
MKWLLSLFFLVFAHVFTTAQTVSSTCTPSAAFVYSYQNDAKDLALKRIYELHSADTARIEIPQIWSDSILNDMAGICNLGTALFADSVFTVYCVHAVPYGNAYKALTVKVDTTHSWTHAWASMNTITGNTALDNFLAAHGFTITNYYIGFADSAYNNRARISTTHILNIKAFADSLVLFPGVEYANIDPNIGDGDHIKYSTQGARHIAFYLGWTDCIAGCWDNKVWYYTLDSTCTVTLDSVMAYLGTPLPAPLRNCHLGPNLVANVNIQGLTNVWPNPVKDLLHISITGTNVTESKYYLSDLLSRVQLTGTAQQLTTLNVGNRDIYPEIGRRKWARVLPKTNKRVGV